MYLFKIRWNVFDNYIECSTQFRENEFLLFLHKASIFPCSCSLLHSPGKRARISKFAFLGRGALDITVVRIVNNFR